MKTALRVGLTALTVGLTTTHPAHAQPTPTTRILAIGTFPAGTDLDAVRAGLPAEVREAVKLDLGGQIDQWFSLADRRGVVRAYPRPAAAVGFPIGASIADRQAQ